MKSFKIKKIIKLIIILIGFGIVVSIFCYKKFNNPKQSKTSAPNEIYITKEDNSFVFINYYGENVSYDFNRMKIGDILNCDFGFEYSKSFKQFTFDMEIGSSFELVDDLKGSNDTKSVKKEKNHYIIEFKEATSLADISSIKLKIIDSNRDNAYIKITNFKAMDSNDEWFKYNDYNTLDDIKVLYFYEENGEFKELKDENKSSKYKYECNYYNEVEGIYKNYALICSHNSEYCSVLDIKNKEIITMYQFNTKSTLINNYVITKVANGYVSEIPKIKIFNLDTQKNISFEGVSYSLFYEDYSDYKYINPGLLIYSISDQESVRSCFESNYFCNTEGYYLLDSNKWVEPMKKDLNIYNQFYCVDYYEYDDCDGYDYLIIEDDNNVRVKTIDGKDFNLSNYSSFNNKYEIIKYYDKDDMNKYLIFDNTGKFVLTPKLASYVKDKDSEDKNIVYSRNGSDYVIFNPVTKEQVKFRIKLSLIELSEQGYIALGHDTNNEIKVQIFDYDDKLLYTFDDSERFNADSFKSINTSIYKNNLIIYNVYDYEKDDSVTLTFNFDTLKLEIDE